jgi:mannose-6-phosphate isomerase-like protein (cupin superfamily)
MSSDTPPSRRRLLSAAAMLHALQVYGAGPEKLSAQVVDGKHGRVTHEAFGDLCVYYEGPTDQLRSMTAGSLRLKGGQAPHPPHKHDEEEFILVTEGSGEISIEGQPVTKAGPGAMLYCPAGKVHGIVNTGRTPLTFYYYKWRV